MRSVRSFFFTLAGLTFVGIVALFTASIAILIAGALSVILVGQAMASYFSYQLAPQPNQKSNAGPGGQQIQREMRIWNDGKGTIIDM